MLCVLEEGLKPPLYSIWDWIWHFLQDYANASLLTALEVWEWILLGEKRDAGNLNSEIQNKDNISFAWAWVAENELWRKTKMDETQYCFAAQKKDKKKTEREMGWVHLCLGVLWQTKEDFTFEILLSFHLKYHKFLE